MEQVGWRGEVTDEPVNVVHLLHFEIFILGREVSSIIIAHLQETLNTSTGVLWALCGQKQSLVRIIVSSRATRISKSTI